MKSTLEELSTYIFLLLVLLFSAVGYARHDQQSGRGAERAQPVKQTAARCERAPGVVAAWAGECAKPSSS